MRLSAVAILLASLPLAAQDVIAWADGTTTERCRVTDFTVLEVKYTAGTASSKPSDQVVSLTVSKVKDAYKRGFAARDSNSGDTADFFLGVAREQKDAFLAQFGFWEAGKFLMEAGKEAEAFPILDELISKHPDSGFVPRAFAMKLDYYLATGKGKSAEAVAKAYKEAATTKGYPNGYQQEAQFYATMAQASSGALKPPQLRGQLETLVATSDSGNPLVANRARLQIANSLRQEGKGDEALALYTRIGGEKVVDKTTLAGAMLGTGHLHMAKGSEAEKEPYRSALLAFLHVYIDTPDASPDVVAEALFHGADAAMKWGGSDHRLMAGRLRNLLRNDTRFNDTEWAKK